MAISAVIVLALSVWGMSVGDNREYIFLSIPVLLLGGMAFISRLLLKSVREKETLRQEKEALRQGKEELLHIINNMPLLYINQEMVTDDHGVITDVVFRDVNDRFEKIMRREDCIGKPASQLFPDSIGLFNPSISSIISPIKIHVMISRYFQTETAVS